MYGGISVLRQPQITWEQEKRTTIVTSKISLMHYSLGAKYRQMPTEKTSRRYSNPYISKNQNSFHTSSTNLLISA